MLSIWESTTFHRKAHFTVVGGGIVGLFAALFHKRAHPAHHVVVVERGPFPSGASVKNAGFACFGSPSELLADRANEGEDAMLQRVEERWRGLLALRAELGDAGIGFQPTGGHEIYRKGDALYPQVAEGFDDLNRSLQPIFGRTVFAHADGLIGAMGLGAVEHLVRTDFEGPVDSGLLMRNLLAEAMAAGIHFAANCEVERVEDEGTHVAIVLRGGDRLHAEQVLVATNGYTAALLPKLDVVPARGQVLMTTPVEGLALRGTYHLDEGYYYFRDHGGAVLLGGGRNLDIAGETTTADAVTPQIQAALEQLLREVILPGRSFAIAQRWSGIMGFGSTSKSPLVERTSERVGVAVRLGGMGVAIGIRVAQRAVAMMAR